MMLSKFRSLPSPALVISSIALILAVGGGSFALAISDKKIDKKIAKKVANKQITKRAAGLSVSHANTADNATNANNAANADRLDNLDSSDIGLGFFTGRVKDLLSTGTTGSPPSGLSTAINAAAVTEQDLTLSPNRSIAMRDLSVALTQAVTCGGICGPSENVTVTLQALAGTTPTAALSCNILPSASSCTAVGPSATVPANSQLRFRITQFGDAQIPASTDAMFSWRATAP